MDGQLPICPKHKLCGGCSYQGVPYERQCEDKQRAVEKMIGPFCRVFPITAMSYPYYYRNKVHAAFDFQKGRAVSGIYQGNSHCVVETEHCQIENEKADAILHTVRDMLKSFKIRIYGEDSGRGLLRHVLIRIGAATGEVMVVFVTSSPIFPSKNAFVRVLRERHPEITTIVLNINDQDTSMVLGEREKVLYGKGYIEDVLCGLRFRISSRSFYQVNSVQTERLYEKAIRLAGLTGKETVIDAYCGIGSIGLIAARRARRMIGVELNEDAVRDAIGNAKQNEIQNIEFYCEDAGKFMEEMAANGESADVLFMDPPRSGSSEVFLKAAAQLAPKQIVYISCNPETMKKDLEYLTGHGYRGLTAWPFDMFPFTSHIECVAVLKRDRQTENIL